MVIWTSDNDIKERLSVGYLTTVAARAGCQVLKPETDKQSVDATVRPISGRRLVLDFQLKATSSDCIDGDFIKYDLPVKNYNDLRDPFCTAPIFLIVFVLSEDAVKWLIQNEEYLVVHGCAYWLSLRGAAPTANKDTVRVRIPRSQTFDVECLKGMMTVAFDAVAPAGEEGAV